MSHHGIHSELFALLQMLVNTYEVGWWKFEFELQFDVHESTTETLTFILFLLHSSVQNDTYIAHIVTYRIIILNRIKICAMLYIYICSVAVVVAVTTMIAFIFLLYLFGLKSILIVI